MAKRKRPSSCEFEVELVDEGDEGESEMVSPMKRRFMSHALHTALEVLVALSCLWLS